MGAKAKSKHRPARGIRHILSTCKGKHSRANEAFMCKKMPSTPSKVRSYQTSARPIRLSRPEWGVWSACVAGKARQAFHSWWGLGMGLGMEPWSCCACHVVLREARGRDSRERVGFSNSWEQGREIIIANMVLTVWEILH